MRFALFKTCRLFFPYEETVKPKTNFDTYNDPRTDEKKFCSTQTSMMLESLITL